MASDLGVSISVSAVVGGALSGLTSVGKAMDTLKTTTDNLRRHQTELGETLTRNKERLGVASAKQLWQEYDKIGASIAKLEVRYSKLNAVRAQKAVNQQKWEGIKSSWAGALAAAGTLAAPVTLAIDFESSMAGVKKVVDFDTPQQFKEMGQDVLTLTRSIPMAATEIADIVAAGGRAGIAKENLLGFAEDAAKMGVAFDMAAGHAGESMATLSNVLQIPITKVGVLGDAINHLSDNANSNAADIVNVLTRVGSDIKQLGLTEDQGAALGSTFLSFGKQPELAAQAIKGMTTSLSVLKAGGGKKELAELGLTTQDFARAMNEDAQGAISDLLARVKQLPKDQQYPLLMKMFGKNYADDVLLLANGVGEYNRQLGLLEEKDASGNLKYLGSMQREFENQAATTANQLRLLKSGFIELGIVLGNVVLPAVNEFVQMGIRLAHTLTDWANRHPKLTKVIIGTAASLLAFRAGGFVVMAAANRIQAGFLALKGGFLALKASATMLRLIMLGGIGMADVPGRLGAVVRALAAARTAMMGFGLSSMAAMWPIVLIVGAVALAALLIYKYWTPIKAFFTGLWDGIKDGIKPIMPLFEMIAFGWQQIWEVVLKPIIGWFFEFEEAGSDAADTAQGFGYFIGHMLGSVFGQIINLGQMIVDGWRMIFDGLFAFADTVWMQITAAFDGGLLGILDLIVRWSPIIAFKNAFAAVLGWFGVELPASFTTFGDNIISGLWNGIKAKWDALKAWWRGESSLLGVIFGQKNEIKSPSRLFKRFGGFMMEGLQIGLANGAPRPLAAIGGLASNLQQRFTTGAGELRSNLSARMQANSAEFAQARSQQAAAAVAGGGYTIHYSPTIHAPGGDPQQIQAAMQMGLREFEDMFNRLMDSRARRAY
ncbi:phage tail tape measure protein [Paralysiella testudinis]|uniref:Phage tail tape measure protein n=2 Tax=Paralysiella testudinis TaxID=2809020 RepID=A0A892ZJS3_9NEIS|nr:phage tail tape measure protein [Paralysiella testudinis]QRQ82067.1 phage tail tape measure protein [Paralysiella testudinis]